MSTSRTPASSKPASKKKVSAATAKTPASIAKPVPKPRTDTSTAKTTKPRQAKSTIKATEVGQPRTTRRVAAKKSIAPEERNQMIAHAAYFLAERHGFSSGRALDDWIAAEKEIDSMLESAG